MRWKISIDADVRHDDARVSMPREHVDRRAAAQEVEHHLRCDLAWIRADTFRGDAVVGREREDDGVLERWVEAAGHPGEADRQFLQHPKAACGFGQLRLTRHSLAHRLLIEGRDRHLEFADLRHVGIEC